MRDRIPPPPLALLWQFPLASPDPRKLKTNTGKSVPFCSSTSYPILPLTYMHTYMHYTATHVSDVLEGLEVASTGVVPIDWDGFKLGIRRVSRCRIQRGGTPRTFQFGQHYIQGHSMHYADGSNDMVADCPVNPKSRNNKYIVLPDNFSASSYLITSWTRAITSLKRIICRKVKI